MKKILVVLSLILSATISAQERTIAFYNVENLFDTLDHPVKNDNEFLPDGRNNWDSPKYWEKIAHINQVIAELNNPVLLGMCEIENAAVVQDIIDYKENSSYKMVHYESLDQRGIDNAMIYDTTTLSVVNSGIIRFDMPEPSSPSRDIVWGKFSLKNSNDTILAMVNHWPSRRGGQAESEPKRLIAAVAAKSFIDSVQMANPKIKIVFMGDLNDYPTNIGPEMIAEVLNPMITPKSGEFGGTHNYRGEWNILDHMMISKSFKKGKVKALKNSGTIYSPEYLLSTYKGNIVPNRTYGGGKYLGGYSDHLPISISVRIK